MVSRYPPSAGQCAFIAQLAAAAPALPRDLIMIVFDYYPQDMRCLEPVVCFADNTYGFHKCLCILCGRCYICGRCVVELRNWGSWPAEGHNAACPLFGKL